MTAKVHCKGTYWNYRFIYTISDSLNIQNNRLDGGIIFILELSKQIPVDLVKLVGFLHFIGTITPKWKIFLVNFFCNSVDFDIFCEPYLCFWRIFPPLSEVLIYQYFSTGYFANITELYLLIISVGSHVFYSYLTYLITISILPLPLYLLFRWSLMDSYVHIWIDCYTL